MKFLKKDSTEGNSVAGILDKLALSHPEISFRFIRDGKEQLHTPGDGKLSSTIYAVYGREFSSTLMPSPLRAGPCKGGGLYQRAHLQPAQPLHAELLHQRPVHPQPHRHGRLGGGLQGLHHGGQVPRLRAAPAPLLWGGGCERPPAKLEVRFVNERPIFDAVYHGVKSALHAGDKPKVMELKRPPVNPYAPVLERKEQLRMETPPPARKPQTPPRPVAVPPVQPPQKESAPPAREPSFLLRDSEAPRREHRGFFPAFWRMSWTASPSRSLWRPLPRLSL